MLISERWLSLVNSTREPSLVLRKNLCYVVYELCYGTSAMADEILCIERHLGESESVRIVFIRDEDRVVAKTFAT